MKCEYEKIIEYKVWIKSREKKVATATIHPFARCSWMRMYMCVSTSG